ncbi:MAG: hypothetical protein NC132_04715 [Corallococcus sp.]|nr:hypothetical protein [Corallococcus sp.]MCM1359689.1 hypothetical protein [Corallococcus sp.]MCM1395398.1 hypothetical protein [Corallococcus sp.]
MIIALTTVMFIAVLVMAPLRARVAFCLNFAQKVLIVRLKIFHITFFNEKFTLNGKYLNCQGSVDTKINLPEIDPKGGKFYLKAVVVDSVNVTVATNYIVQSPQTMVILEGLVFMSTTVACALSNCKIHVATQMANSTAIYGEARMSVSLAGVFLAMFRSWANSLKTGKKA